MVFVCSCDTKEKVQKEVNASLEQYEMFAMECVKDHAKDDCKKSVEAIRSHKKKVSTDDILKDVMKDSEAINSKCFDHLFDKYGEEMVIEAIKNFASSKTYKEIEIKSKDDFYERLNESLKLMYMHEYTSNLETEKLNLELELLKLKTGY
jgi:hypothetical protein